MDKTATEAKPNPGALPLFYKDPHVLEPGRHGDAGLGEGDGARFAAATNSIPLAADEFFAAQAHYPIVFTGGTEKPAPVAVVGLVGERNVFIDAAGKWREGTYVPAYVRRYPFIFVRSGGTPERWLLAVDEDSAPYRREGGKAFFEKGEPTEATRQALAFCATFQRQFEAGQGFAAALAERELLVDYRAEIEVAGTRKSLTGFRIIDEAKFNALPDDVFLDWRKRGFVALAYAQLASMLRWHSLAAATRGAEDA